MFVNIVFCGTLIYLMIKSREISGEINMEICIIEKEIKSIAKKTASQFSLKP